VDDVGELVEGSEVLSGTEVGVNVLVVVCHSTMLLVVVAGSVVVVKESDVVVGESVIPTTDSS
jgi:hypothetical protein